MAKITRYTRNYSTFCLLGRKPAHFAKKPEKIGLKREKRGSLANRPFSRKKGVKSLVLEIAKSCIFSVPDRIVDPPLHFGADPRKHGVFGRKEWPKS
jgi:hypothetical protein